MSAAEYFTDLQPPPEYRGAPAEAYCREIAKWALKYHLMIEPIAKDFGQRLANIAAVAQLTQTISSPPTQAEVVAIQDKINEIITAATET